MIELPPGVGVVGYTLGGGLSPTLGRSLGYAADHVTDIELVTAAPELPLLQITRGPTAVRGAR